MADELRLESRPSLKEPVLVTAFRGWNDGGQGASLAIQHLVTTWDAEKFADIDPGGVLRLPGDAAARLAHRRTDADTSTGRRTTSSTRAPASATSCCSSALSRTSAGGRSPRSSSTSSRISASSSSSASARCWRTSRTRDRPRSPGQARIPTSWRSSASRPHATRGRRASSACSTTRAARPASPP